MGLDNIPREYPCKVAHEAILIKEVVSKEGGGTKTIKKIDCDATQRMGRCTWKKSAPSSGKISGMFGTSCWYRGKYGNYLLEILDIEDQSFYGEDTFDDDGEGLSPESCIRLATTMREKMARLTPGDEGYDLLPDMEYAAWWLEFVADKAYGSSVWY